MYTPCFIQRIWLFGEHFVSNATFNSCIFDHFWKTLTCILFDGKDTPVEKG